MDVQYCDVMISAARTVDNVVVDIEENESWPRLNVPTVPVVWYRGKGTEVLHKMRQEFKVENQGIVNPTQVWWLANPHTIRERRQNREISTSSVVFLVMGSRVSQIIINKEIKAEGMWEEVETYTM